MGVGIMQENINIARRILKCDSDWSLENLLAIFQAQKVDIKNDSLTSSEYSIFAGKVADH